MTLLSFSALIIISIFAVTVLIMPTLKDDRNRCGYLETPGMSAKMNSLWHAPLTNCTVWAGVLSVSRPLR